MNDGTLLGTIVLMFIGGGSAGTAGGIKVTTFAAALHGDRHRGPRRARRVRLRRRVGSRAVRQALAVAPLSVVAVLGATVVLLESIAATSATSLFEVTSAFGTVGLSTGITADLPTAGQFVLVALMFLGRLGPITLVTSLALRERRGATTTRKAGPSLVRNP